MARMQDSTGFATLVVIAFVILASGTSWGGGLEPSAPPGPTMKTLDQVPPTWSQVLPASTRFVLVLGGAGVLDKETGLVWEQAPSMSTFEFVRAWQNCIELAKGGRMGWRMPLTQELFSLLDPAQTNSLVNGPPALPQGHPFSNVTGGFYWVFDRDAPPFNNNANMLSIQLQRASINTGDISNTFPVWCVRGPGGSPVPW